MNGGNTKIDATIREQGLRPAQIALVALCSLLPAIVKLYYYPDYPGSDDAFIHFSVIQNIHRGWGWGVNAGEPVFLSTSPLFTVFFSAVRSLTGHVVETGMALSLMAGSLYVLGVFVLAIRSCGSFFLSMVCAFLAATNVHLWRWNGTFMEVTFATCAVVWIVALFLSVSTTSPRRILAMYPLIGFLTGLGILLRPEISLILPAFFLHSLLNDRIDLGSRYGMLAVGLAVVLGPFAALVHAYFGVFLPTTFAAKTTTGLVWVNGTVWTQIFKTVASGGCGAGGAVVVLLALAWRSPARCSLAEAVRRSAVFWAIPVMGFLFYSLKTTELQSAARYYLPFMGTLPLVLLAAPNQLSLRPGMVRAVLITACVMQVAVSGVLNHRVVAPVLSRMASEYIPTMTQAAHEVNARAKSGDSLLVYTDIGVVASQLSRSVYLIDGGGLASPWLQRMSLGAMVSRTRPRFVLESLGTDPMKVDRALTAGRVTGRLIWSQAFHSHSVEDAGIMYVARLYELDWVQ
jgi:hypothetical protein